LPKSSAKSSTRTKTAPFDIADYLHTPEDIAACLEARLDEAPDDAAGIARALGAIPRAKGMGQIAKQAGVSRESLYRALGAKGNPSLATVLKVTEALGVRLHIEAA
jgi:probable addiction module antidote protein